MDGLTIKKVLSSDQYRMWVTGEVFWVEKGDAIVVYSMRGRSYFVHRFFELNETLHVSQDFNGSVTALISLLGIEKPSWLNSGISLFEQVIVLLGQKTL